MCDKKKIIKSRIAALMVIIVTISLFPILKSSAFGNENEQKLSFRDKLVKQVLLDTKEELERAKKEKEEKEKELASAQNQLNQTNSDLSNLKKVQSSYQGEMQTLNTELQLVADNLAVLEIKAQIKEKEIEETQIILDDTIEKQKEQYESMKLRIRFMYENNNNIYVETLVSSKSFGEFLNYTDYIEGLSKYDRQKLDEYIETGKVISENMAQIKQEYAELEELKKQAEEEQSKVTGLISKTADNIAATAETIDDVSKEAAVYEANCNAKAQEAAAANAEYEAIKKQYEEECRLAEIARASAWRDISEVTFDESDRYLLANLIYCEAGNQPYDGKLAVGSVVINRLLSSRYPDTVAGVIYQNKQFSPVGDGHLASALANNKATESCYQAADEAMSGVTNVGNCLYFRTPIEGLTGIQIGAHIFY